MHRSGGRGVGAQPLRLPWLARTDGERASPFRSAWGGQLVATELADAEQAVGALTGARAFPGGAAVGGVAVTRGRRAPETLALSAYNAAAADRLLGREQDWQPIAASLRDGLIAAVTR